MEISLAQAIHLKKIIAGVISELNRERFNVAFIEVEKGEKYEKPVRDFFVIDEELKEARKDYRDLDVLISHHNLGANIKWDDKDITITEAIELAKQMRLDISNLKSHFANAKQQENLTGFYDSNMVRLALLDIEKMKKYIKKQERMVNRLSQLIDEKNHLIKFEFKAAEKYI